MVSVNNEPATPEPTRVLVVDDCRDTTDSTAELIGLWGHDARRAYAGAAALELAAEYRPDVLLVDLGMRGVDGGELARRPGQQCLGGKGPEGRKEHPLEVARPGPPGPATPSSGGGRHCRGSGLHDVDSRLFE